MTFTDTFADSLRYAPEFGDGLSNHLPMGLVAAQRLEARLGLKGRVAAFSEAYSPRLETVAVAVADGVDGEPKLGDWQSLAGFEMSYARRMAKHGIEITLRDVLPTLGLGVAATAGHGLLRVYFAVEARDILAPELVERELARGLAYWSARYGVLSAVGSGAQPMAAVLACLPSLPPDEKTRIERLRLITDRQSLVAESPIFRRAVGDVGDIDVLAVASTLATVAVGRPDFTLLHALTTAQAILGLEEAIPNLDTTALRRGWSHFVIAAFLTEGFAVEPVRLGASVDQLRDALGTTTNDHALKSAFSLLRLYDRTRDTVFLDAAVRFAGAFGGAS